MEYYVTNEEIEALKLYRGLNYKAINQMLVSNSSIDVSYLKEQMKDNLIPNFYSRENIVKYIDIVKKLYELIQKVFYSKNGYQERSFYRGTNIFETERILNEPYIDRFLSVTTNKNKAKERFALKWNNPILMKVKIPRDMPYVNVNKVLNVDDQENDEYIISPFTIVKEIKELDTEGIEEYELTFEKQELEKLSASEREGLYSYIMNTSEIIDIKLKEIIELEEISIENNENIRKLEQLLEKYKSNTESQVVDIDDINRINRQISEIKEDCREIEIERKNIEKFITNWKRNIVVYLIAECQEIEEKYIVDFNERVEENVLKTIEEENSFNDETDSNTGNIENENNVVTEEQGNNNENMQEVQISENGNETLINAQEEVSVSEGDAQNYNQEVDKNVENVENSTENSEEFNKVVEANETEETTIDENSKGANVKKECLENIKSSEKLLDDIQNLISKQQNHAKVAGNLGTIYSALNNGFEMKKASENLNTLLKNLKLKVNAVIEETEEEEKLKEKLENISKVNLQISTLFNYLNNPKSSIGMNNITRFDEMLIIEENELKRGIYQTVRDTAGEAELKKLKEDFEIIEEKSPLERLIGIFTGKNRLDEIIMDQIEIRQNAIRKTLAHKLSIAKNYSIHDIVAKINMFVEENNDDYLVEDEVAHLEKLEKELKNNFIILDSKVNAIVFEKEGEHLPVNDKKLTKKEKIEMDTYKFLSKYEYNVDEKDDNIKYQDTMTNEISRISEYINSSNVF